MSKNIMRTPEEKEKIVLEMINNGYGFHTMSKKYDISKSVLSKWYYSYKEKGIEAGIDVNYLPYIMNLNLFIDNKYAKDLGVTEDDIEAAIFDSIAVSAASYKGEVDLVGMKGE